MSNRISIEEFIKAIHHVSGVVSLVSQECCVSSGSNNMTCYCEDAALHIIGKDTAAYSAPHYSFPVESIMRVERMACRDGSTEFEVTLQGGVLTMDVKAVEEVEDAEAKIA